MPLEIYGTSIGYLIQVVDKVPTNPIPVPTNCNSMIMGVRPEQGNPHMKQYLFT